MKKRVLSFGLCLIMVIFTVFSNTALAFEGDETIICSEGGEEAIMLDEIYDEGDVDVEETIAEDTEIEETIVEDIDEIETNPNAGTDVELPDEIEGEQFAEIKKAITYDRSYSGKTKWAKFTNIKYTESTRMWTYDMDCEVSAHFSSKATLWYSEDYKKPVLKNSNSASYYDYHDYYVEGYEPVAENISVYVSGTYMKYMLRSWEGKKNGYYVLEVYNEVDENTYSNPESFFENEGLPCENVVNISDATYFAFDKLEAPSNLSIYRDGNYTYVKWDSLPAVAGITTEKYRLQVLDPEGEIVYEDKLYRYQSPKRLTENNLTCIDKMKEGKYTFRLCTTENEYSDASYGKPMLDSDYIEKKVNLLEMNRLEAVSANTDDISNGIITIPYYESYLPKTYAGYDTIESGNWFYYVEIYKKGSEKYPIYYMTYSANDTDYSARFNAKEQKIEFDINWLLNNGKLTIDDINAQYYFSVSGWTKLKNEKLRSLQATNTTTVPIKFLNDEKVTAPVIGKVYGVGTIIPVFMSSDIRNAKVEWINKSTGKTIATGLRYTPTEEDVANGLQVKVTVNGSVGEVVRDVIVKDITDPLEGTLIISEEPGEIRYSYPNDIVASFTCTNEDKPSSGKYIFTWMNDKGEILQENSVDIRGSVSSNSLCLATSGNYSSGTIGSNNIGNCIYCVVTCEADINPKSGSIVSESIGPVVKDKIVLSGMGFLAPEINAMNDGVDYYGNKDARYSTGGIIKEPYETKLTFRSLGIFEYCLTDKGEAPTYDEGLQKYSIINKGGIDREIRGLKANTEYTLWCHYPETATEEEMTVSYTLVTKDHAEGREYKDNSAEYRHDVYCTECKEIIKTELHVDRKINGTETKGKDGLCDYCGARVYNLDAMHIENLERTVYTGSALKPSFDVFIGNSKLKAGTDYKVEYKNNIKAGNKDSVDAKGNSIAPTIIVTGKGGFVGTVTTTFEIEPVDIESIELGDLVYVYSGKDIAVNTTLKVNGKTLKKGTDYDVVMFDEYGIGVDSCKNAGKYIAKFEGKGNYKGTVTADVYVSYRLTKNLKVSAIPDQSYTKSEIKPIPQIYDGKTNVTECFFFTYKDNIQTGTATITIIPCDDIFYYGKREVTFNIVKKNLSKATIMQIGEYEYTGREVKPELIDDRGNPGVYYNYRSIEPGDYSESYANNINVGTAKVTINATENGIYTGSKTATFKIVPFDVGKDANINKIQIGYAGDKKSISETNITVPYSAGKEKPEITLFYTSNPSKPSEYVELTKNKDYTISYANATNAADKDAVDSKGKSIGPKIVVTFKGNYKGKLEIPYTIGPADLSGANVSWNSNVAAYSGKAVILAPTVTYDGKTLALGKDYYISEYASDNESLAITTVSEVRTYNLYIHGKGNYSGKTSTCYYLVGTDKKLISSLKVNAIPTMKYQNGKSGGGACMPHPVSQGLDLVTAVKEGTSKPLYTVSYENNEAVRTATVIIKATEDNDVYYSEGEKRVTFKIAKNDFSGANFYERKLVSVNYEYTKTSPIPDVYYTGYPIDVDTPNVHGFFQNNLTLFSTVGNEQVQLIEGSRNSNLTTCDYYKEWINTDKVGTATLRIYGLNAYEGCTKDFKFKIVPLDVSKNADKIQVQGATGFIMSSGIISTYYTGSAIKPEPILTDNHSYTLVKGKDYTLSYKNNINAAAEDATDAKGKSIAPTIVVTFKGNYKGKLEIPFKIGKTSIGKTTVSWPSNVAKYTGKQIKLNPTVTYNGKKLTLGKDYTLQDENGNAVTSVTGVKGEQAAYNITVIGIGGFYLTQNLPTFYVEGKSKLITELPIDSIPTQVYVGKEVRPGDNGLIKSKGISLDIINEFDISYVNNDEAGTATAIIKAKADNTVYSTQGEKRVTFKISAFSIKNAKLVYNGDIVTAIPNQVYTGEEICPFLNLQIAGTNYTLEELCDVKWSNNVKAGTASLKLTGKSICTGTRTISYKIVPFDVSNGSGYSVKDMSGDISLEYTKKKQTPKPTLQFVEYGVEEGVTLTEGKDYTLSYENNTAICDAGAGDKAPKIVVKFKGNYAGTMKIPFTITPVKITPDDYEIYVPYYTESGIKSYPKLYDNETNDWKFVPTVRLTQTGKVLKEGVDYEVMYLAFLNGSNYCNLDGITNQDIINLNKGYNSLTDAFVKDYMKGDKKCSNESSSYFSFRIIFKGDYENDYSNSSGSYEYVYNLTKQDISEYTFNAIDRDYTGEPIEITSEWAPCKDNDGNTVSVKFVPVPGTYKNNVKTGTASVTVIGYGDYAGVKTINFKIVPVKLTWWELLSSSL